LQASVSLPTADLRKQRIAALDDFILQLEHIT
jgi:hypothetical protein